MTMNSFRRDAKRCNLNPKPHTQIKSHSIYLSIYLSIYIYIDIQIYRNRYRYRYRYK